MPGGRLAVRLFPATCSGWLVFPERLQQAGDWGLGQPGALLLVEAEGGSM